MIEIYTDASIKEGRGAWAAIVVMPHYKPVELFGALRGRGWGSSTAVEAAAMGNALHAAAQRGLLPRGSTVILRCDNMIACQRINRHAFKKSDRKVDRRILDAIAYAHAFAERRELTLSAEWVKGHQRLDSADPHMPYNRRCDALCSAVRDGRKPPSARMFAEQLAAGQRRAEKAARKAITQEAFIAELQESRA